MKDKLPRIGGRKSLGTFLNENHRQFATNFLNFGGNVFSSILTKRTVNDFSSVYENFPMGAHSILR